MVELYAFGTNQNTQRQNLYIILEKLYIMPYLTLMPTKSAVDRKLAGFQSGNPLKLNFKQGEKASVVLHRFNTYRGPDSQIKALYLNQDLKGQLLLDSQLQNDLVVWIA